MKELDDVCDGTELERAGRPLCPRCHVGHLRRLGLGDFGFWECPCGFYAARL